MGTIDEFIWVVISSIPDSALSVSTEDLYTKLYSILKDIPLRINDLESDYCDDVSYAPYKINGEKWEAVCVQEFDMKDYEPSWFLLDTCINGDIWSVAVMVQRYWVWKYFLVELSIADDVACALASEICKVLVV